jgi:hypothetical protein
MREVENLFGFNFGGSRYGPSFSIRWTTAEKIAFGLS